MGTQGTLRSPKTGWEALRRNMTPKEREKGTLGDTREPRRGIGAPKKP